MPFVAAGEALDLPFVDLDSLAASLGPPPWRTCLVGTPSLRVILLSWAPGSATTPHVHPGGEEVFHVLAGRAGFTIGDEPEREVTAGAFLVARRGIRHAIRVLGDEPLTLLAAVAPNEDRPDEAIEVP